jgi:hypothetical protein
VKSFKALRNELNESIFDKIVNLFKKDEDAPLSRSRNVIIRPKDMRHKTVGVTVMLKKHKDHRVGREAYDWTLREPSGAMKRYFGTLKKNKNGGWTVMGIGKNSKPQIEIENRGDSLKAIKKIYKLLSKVEGSTSLPYPLISRGNASSRSLTN